MQGVPCRIYFVARRHIVLAIGEHDVYTWPMAKRGASEEHQLHVRLTHGEWMRLRRLAVAAGLKTASAYIKHHIATTELVK